MGIIYVLLFFLNRLQFMSRLTAFVAANCTMLIFRRLLTNTLSQRPLMQLVLAKSIFRRHPL